MGELEYYLISALCKSFIKRIDVRGVDIKRE